MTLKHICVHTLLIELRVTWSLTIGLEVLAKFVGFAHAARKTTQNLTFDTLSPFR